MATSPRPSEEKGAEIWTRLHLSMGLFIHFSGLLFLSAVCGLPAAWGEQENGGSVILSADVKPVTRVEGRRKEHSSCRHSFNQVTNPNGRVVLSLFRGTALSPATTTTTATNKTTTDRNINRLLSSITALERARLTLNTRLRPFFSVVPLNQFRTGAIGCPPRSGGGGTGPARAKMTIFN